MRKKEIEWCISYLRFVNALTGEELSEADEEIISAILREERECSEVIEWYIAANNLDTEYRADADEMGKYPGSLCYVNYFNLTDRSTLKKAEAFFSSVRTAGMFSSPIDARPSFSFYERLHERLFSDLYPSAGMIRSEDSSKNLSFCRAAFIEKSAEDIFDRLSAENYLKDISDRDSFISELAYFYAEIEVLHPFRDGNLRTLMFFTLRLIEDAGFETVWENADADRMLEASIAAIDGDYQLLIDVFSEIIL